MQKLLDLSKLQVLRYNRAFDAIVLPHRNGKGHSVYLKVSTDSVTSASGWSLDDAGERDQAIRDIKKAIRLTAAAHRDIGKQLLNQIETSYLRK